MIGSASAGQAGAQSPSSRRLSDNPTHISPKLASLCPCHEAVQHLLLSGAVEGDGEFVALDMHNIAAAELLVEHAVANRECRHRAGRFCHQLALDSVRAGAAPGAVRLAASATDPP